MTNTEDDRYQILTLQLTAEEIGNIVDILTATGQHEKLAEKLYNILRARYLS